MAPLSCLPLNLPPRSVTFSLLQVTGYAGPARARKWLRRVHVSRTALFLWSHMCVHLAVAIAIAATRLDSGRVAAALLFTIVCITLAFGVGWCRSALSASPCFRSLSRTYPQSQS